MLTQAGLKELLHYFPVEGVFVWRVSRGTRAAGSLAGGANNQGYLRIMISRKNYKAHRLAFLYMEGWMPVEVDHRDHIRDNNSWDNLRAATPAINQQNRSPNGNNTSGANGVHRDKNRGKWRAKVQVNGKTVHLGYFDKFEDAVAAREAANIKYGFHPNHGAPS